jgi:hypothetical protein
MDVGDPEDKAWETEELRVARGPRRAIQLSRSHTASMSISEADTKQNQEFQQFSKQLAAFAAHGSI